MIEIYADLQLMTAKPFLLRKLVNGEQFHLIGGPRPGVKEIATPALRTDHHLFRALAVGIAVETAVSKYGAQKRAGAELVSVEGPDGHPPLAVIGRGCL